MIFFFHGHGCEYVLHDLCKNMRARGFSCIEADTLKDDIRKAISLAKGERVIYVTSAHLLLDNHNFKLYYESEQEILSPLEVIKELSPSQSFFVPHDLSRPLLKEEIPYISVFDGFISPFEGYSTGNLSVQCFHLGCPRLKNTKEVSPQYEAIWFVSNITNNLSSGFDSFYNWIKPLTSAGCAIKLPRWNGMKALEEKLRKNDVDIVSCETNIFQAMNGAEVVITNGTSSVVTESCLYGKKTINILSPREVDSEQSLFAHFKELVFCTTPEEALRALPRIPKGENKLRAFDIEEFISIVTNKEKQEER